MIVGRIILLTSILFWAGCRTDEEELKRLEQEVAQDAAAVTMDSLDLAQKSLSGQADDRQAESVELQTKTENIPPQDSSPIESTSVVDSPEFGGDRPGGVVQPNEESRQSHVSGTGMSGAAPSYMIVVGSYARPELAESKAEEYRKRGYPASVQEIEIDGKSLFRVYIGGYATFAEAKRVGEDMRAQLGLDYWIGQEP